MKNLSTAEHGWRHPSTRSNTLNLASDEKRKSMKTKNSKNFGQSPFKAIEVISYDKIKDHRSEGRKASEHFIRITARSIMKDIMPEKADMFIGSKGWFHRFLRRKGIKCRKRKSGKKSTGEENIDKIIR